MTRGAELPPIPVVRDPSIPITGDLLNPHYDDPRFREKNIGRVVFLAPDAELDSTARLADAFYMNSGRLVLGIKFAEYKEAHPDHGFAPNSASFFEAAINDLWPRLDRNYPGIRKFGRDIPGVDLVAVTSGIDSNTLFAYNEFAVVLRPAA